MSMKAEAKNNFTYRSKKKDKQKNTFNKYGKYTKRHIRIIENIKDKQKNNIIKKNN